MQLKPTGNHNRQRRLRSPDSDHHNRLLTGCLGSHRYQRSRWRLGDHFCHPQRRRQRCPFLVSF